MPATPANSSALATYIGTVESSRTLIELTNFETDSSATTVNSTVLTAFAAKGIRAFEFEATVYDPDTVPWHTDVAHYLTMAFLHERANQAESCATYVKRAEPLLMRARLSRRLSPMSNSPFEPTGPELGSRPVFDYSLFRDVTGNSQSTTRSENPTFLSPGA